MVARFCDEIECHAMHILAIVNNVPISIYDSVLFHWTMLPFNFDFDFSAGVSCGQLRGYLFAHHLFCSLLRSVFLLCLSISASTSWVSMTQETLGNARP